MSTVARYMNKFSRGETAVIFRQNIKINFPECKLLYYDTKLTAIRNISFCIDNRPVDLSFLCVAYTVYRQHNLRWLNREIENQTPLFDCVNTVGWFSILCLTELHSISQSWKLLSNYHDRPDNFISPNIHYMQVNTHSYHYVYIFIKYKDILTDIMYWRLEKRLW